MRRPLATAGMSGSPYGGLYGSLLAALALAACWLVTALTFALLTQPTTTLTTLDMRGARGVPAVMWSGSRDLVRLFKAAGGGVTYD